MGGNQITQRKPTWIQQEHAGQLHTDRNPSSESNPRPCSCEATTLHSAMLFHPWLIMQKKEKEITDDKCIYVKIDVFDMTCIWQFNSFGRCLFIHSFYPNVESEQQCFCDLNSLSSKPSEPTLSYTALPCGVYRYIDSCNCFCSCYLENVAIFPPGGELGKCANIKNKSKIKHVVGLPLFKLLLMQWYYAMIFTTM